MGYNETEYFKEYSASTVDSNTCFFSSIAILKTSGSLQKSTQVMQAVQSLIKVPEVAKTMQELSKEMMKAGIMEEMINDTFESLEDQEELEEAADQEIDNVSLT